MVTKPQRSVTSVVNTFIGLYYFSLYVQRRVETIAGKLSTVDLSHVSLTANLSDSVYCPDVMNPAQSDVSAD